MGFVKAKGKNIVGPNGEPIRLRGINLGNWFESEGYMFFFDKGPQSTHEIEAFFNELVGPAAARSFWKEYRKRYITVRDIQFLHGSGLNSVRIPPALNPLRSIVAEAHQRCTKRPGAFVAVLLT